MQATIQSQITRPKIYPVSLKNSSQLIGSEYIAQEKKDGVFALMDWQGSVLAGERMRDGFFWAFDIPVCQGDDCRRSTYADRIEALRGIESTFSNQMRIVPQGTGTEFLEAVLANGGEGVVFKHRDGYWGVGQFKAKRTETFDVRVTEKLRNAVAIEFEGQSAGRCAISGSAFDKVRVGEIIEISAFCQTVAGKFREPRFIRVRRDK